MAKNPNFPQFNWQDMGSFKPFEFPGINMETIMSMYQKNMELMSSTQKISERAVQDFMETQKQYAQTLFNKINQQAKQSMSNAPLEEKMTLQAEAVKATVEDLIQHLHKTNSIITKSNEQIIESLQERLKEYMNESSKMVKKGSKGS